MVFKVGKKGTYWYEFEMNGVRHRRSTKQYNERAALAIESAKRTELAKIGAKLEPPPSAPPAPTLREFEGRFNRWVEKELSNPRTQQFYATNFTRLLAFAPLANARLNQIEEPLVESYKDKMYASGVTKVTANRYLATLRKALRYAWRLKLFDRPPVVSLHGDEPTREFIFGDGDYQNWLAASPQPLYSASVLARESAICRGEMLALECDCVTLYDEPDQKGLYGYLDIRRGLKRKSRKRQLPLTAAMRDVLLPLLEQSQCEFVFTALRDRTKPLSCWTLEDQLGQTRKLLKLPYGVGLHSLRHTRLTELARTVDAFTLQRVAGHANIATTMKYVHVQQEAIEDAFASRRGNVPLKVPLRSERPVTVAACD